jgi:hypothetical protein
MSRCRSGDTEFVIHGPWVKEGIVGGRESSSDTNHLFFFFRGYSLLPLLEL